MNAPAIAIPFEEWTHIALTWQTDSSTGEGTLALYVNGDPRGGVANLAAIAYTDNDETYLSPVGSLDDFEFYHSALNATQVRNLVAQPSLQLDFESLSDISHQANQVGGDAPYVSGNQADFFGQGTDLLKIDGQGLDLSAGKFTFSTWIKPEARLGDAIWTDGAWDAYPAIAYSAVDTSTMDSWQHIAGYEFYQDDDDNDTFEIIYAPYPTLAHDNTGKVRLRYGEKNTDNPTSGELCSFESIEGVLDFDTWQYLTVSYNGSQFFVYIDGIEVDNGGGNADCANVSPSESTLYVGGSSLQGYLWL